MLLNPFSSNLFKVYLCLNVLLISSIWCADLYTSGKDNVTVSTNALIQRQINSAEKDYLVEFYHRFCGHCIKFSPHFKAFATRIRDWKNLLEVLVLDCASISNTEACTKASVDGYPTIRYYPKGYGKMQSPYEINVDLDQEPDLEALVALVAAHSQNKVFQPVESSGWQQALPNSYVVLRNLPKKLAVKIILFFTVHSSVPVLWSSLEHNIAIPSSITLVDRNHNDQQSHQFHANVKWDEISETIQTALKQLNLWKDNKPDEPQTSIGDVNEWVPSKSDPDNVHLSDLYSGLSRILHHEVPMRIGEVDAEKLPALQKFMHIVVQYFKGSKSIMESLRHIENSLNSVDVLNTTVWTTIVTDSKFPRVDDKWVTCAGSKSYLRGYPCSLWTLFHALTVEEWKSSVESSSYHAIYGPQVLPAMRAFILNYFSCKDCTNHFRNISAHVVEEAPTTKKSVLWLWRTHNSVNQRLHGESSEDPEHPKVQFPTREHCPQCRTNHDDGDGPQWKYNVVLKYLEQRYYQPWWIIDDEVKDL